MPASHTLSPVHTDLRRITMSGNVSDLPIRYKRAVFTQKKLDRINFRSGNGPGSCDPGLCGPGSCGHGSCGPDLGVPVCSSGSEGPDPGGPDSVES